MTLEETTIGGLPVDEIKTVKFAVLQRKPDYVIYDGSDLIYYTDETGMTEMDRIANVVTTQTVFVITLDIIS